MSLLVIAEILSGETLVSPSGPVDAITTAGEDVVLWDLSDSTRFAEPVFAADQSTRQAQDRVPVGART